MSDYEKRINPGHFVTVDDYQENLLSQLEAEYLSGKASVVTRHIPAEMSDEEIKLAQSEARAELNTTLPTDSAERKNYPMLSGCLKYFPAALAGISKISKLGNDKHNPGQPLHHARGKSTDHGDCIVRHLTDTEDLLAAIDRHEPKVNSEQVLLEVNQLAWRVLAYSQEIHEKFGSPLAPGAKK